MKTKIYTMEIFTYNTYSSQVTITKKQYDQMIRRYKEQLDRQNTDEDIDIDELPDCDILRIKEKTQEYETKTCYLTTIADGATDIMLRKWECKKGYQFK